MNQKTIIEINNLSKVFSKNYKSARVQLKNILVESFLGCKNKTELQKDEFWALKNIFF